MAGPLVTRVDDLGPITGEKSPNRTGSGFGVYGTDLGVLWDNGNGEVLVAFGDTYGPGWGGSGPGPDEADWRWNVLAGSTTTDLAGGMALYPVVTRPDGTAGQVLARDPAVTGEVTVIPTSGIAVDGINYLHYMSVRRWGPPGVWQTNHGGIAVSHDHGRTWTRSARPRWHNRRRGGLLTRRDHPFQLGAFAHRAPYVYLLGTPNGRFGSACLARVAEDSVVTVADYEYWTGRDWVAGDPFAARPVLSGPVGELSVRYNDFLGQWLAVYLDERRAAIVLCGATELTGPWSAPTTLVTAADYPGPYGGYLHPWATGGPEIYFTLSQWLPYNVRLMRAVLSM